MSSTSSSPPPADSLPSQLLHYLSSHKALICTTCHYAIQPNAIPRHLKDIHQIHRARRRPFMSYVSTLDLATPEQVIAIQAKLNVFPVEKLPVIDGLMCRYQGCGHLCASAKRMRSHWLAGHGVAARVGVDWRNVKLQTFFKGNLLRYFSDGVARDDGPKIAADVVVDGMNFEYDIIGPVNIVPSRTPTPTIDTSDTALLHHFITNTASTLSTNPVTQLLWETTVPLLAQSNPFLHHGILACSALHLAHIYPHSPLNTQLTLLASQHQEIAMPLFSTVMTAVTPSNCDAVLAFAHLLIIISFAIDTQAQNRSESQNQNQSSPQSSTTHLMIVSPPAPPMPITTINGNSNAQEGDSILPPWLYLLRSGCSILCDVWDYLELGPISVLAEQWDIPVHVPDGTPPPLLAHLLSLIPSTPNPFLDSNLDVELDVNINANVNARQQKTWTEHQISTYITAARSLDLAFRYRAILGKEFSTWDALRVWPIAIEQDYLDLLATEHEGALVLLGFYCVLLKMVEIRWYFEGRAQRLLRSVLACLDEGEDGRKWRGALRWAIKEVGIEGNEVMKDGEWKGDGI
ncbi:hypothetical protein VTL71DRAFT_11779 [Oculimacula yallundae]|uniref:C2H2-type domain-containing protein n=1 Tax=Oculimacula yallundae TaxID=86028 RepID=A0ABR4CTG1_9HELO